MEHRLLRAFVAVAEELHFGRAARRLHISQPPLSVMIRKLEQDLDTPLLDRTSRRVALTEAGQALLGRARHLLAEAQRAQEEVRRVGRGEGGVLPLGYATPAAYQWLPSVICAHRAAHPATRLELAELRSAAQVDALHEGRIELGFVCLPLDPKGARLQPVLSDPLDVMLPRAHPLAQQSELCVEELQGQPFVMVDPSIEPGWAEATDQALRRAGLHPELAQQTDTKIALMGLVAAGVGIAIGARCTRLLAHPGVVFRPLQGVPLQLEMGLLSSRHPSPRAQALLALAAKFVQGGEQHASPAV
jgi:DNA-binding transcriptional LysR family regulator